jgi:hypothetical protein
VDPPRSPGQGAVEQVEQQAQTGKDGHGEQDARRRRGQQQQGTGDRGHWHCGERDQIR